MAKKIKARPEFMQALRAMDWRRDFEPLREQAKQGLGRAEATATHDGVSALSWAACIGDAAVMLALIEAGARLEARDPGGFTAATFAAQKGHAGCLRVLLGYGADVEGGVKSGEWGWRPMHAAAWTGGAECLAVCLEAGADVWAKTHYGATVGAMQSSSGEEKRGALALWAAAAEREELATEAAPTAKTRRAPRV